MKTNKRGAASSADFSSYASPSPLFGKSGMQRRITAVLGRSSSRGKKLNFEGGKEGGGSHNSNNDNPSDTPALEQEIGASADDLV